LHNPTELDGKIRKKTPTALINKRQGIQNGQPYL
jgi:hypothetical protein